MILCSWWDADLPNVSTLAIVTTVPFFVTLARHGIVSSFRPFGIFRLIRNGRILTCAKQKPDAFWEIQRTGYALMSVLEYLKVTLTGCSHPQHIPLQIDAWRWIVITILDVRHPRVVSLSLKTQNIWGPVRGQMQFGVRLTFLFQKCVGPIGNGSFYR